MCTFTLYFWWWNNVIPITAYKILYIIAREKIDQSALAKKAIFYIGFVNAAPDGGLNNIRTRQLIILGL